MESLIYLGLALLLVVLFAVPASIHILSEFQRLVVLRLGRKLDTVRGPGIVFLIPLLDRGVKVDLREQARESRNNTATTKDSKSLSFSFLWLYKVIEPAQSVIGLGVALDHFEAAAAEIATKKFHQLFLEVNSADLSSERKRVEQEVVAGMNEIAGRFGVQVTGLEITELTTDSR